MQPAFGRRTWRLIEMERRLCFLPLALLLTLGACTTSERTNDKAKADAGQAVQGDWAIVRFESEPDTLNPLTSVTALSQFALWCAKNSQIYELLLGYNTTD